MKGHAGRVGALKAWCLEAGLSVKRLSYADMLAYMDILKGKGLQAVTMNQHLQSIRLYYHYLKKDCPLKGLKLRGRKKQVRRHLLSGDQLEEVLQLYMNRQPARHQLSGLIHERNIVLLSLLIYQGLHSGELSRLQVGDVKLKANRLYIPSTGRSNSRTLKVGAMQGLLLSRYITGTRLKLMAQKGLDSELLFDITGSAHGLVSHLIGVLKGLTPLVHSARQLRDSVIVNWLKQYNLRKVQYMAGHRYVSSTQSYRAHDTRGLKEAISRYHPLG